MAERKRVIPKQYEGKTIYSYSRLTSYNNCNHCYYLGYILKKKGQDNVYNVLGGFLHELLEEAQFGKLTNEEMLQKFKLKLFEVNQILGYNFVSDKVRKNFVESIEQYLQNYEPIICRNFFSEKEFFYEIDNYVLVGYIDGVIENFDDSLEVIDYKSSSAFSKADIEGEKGSQVVLYGLGLGHALESKIESLKFDMMKYCYINWTGKTTERKVFAQRNESIKKIKNEIKKDLQAQGYSDLEISLLINEAEKNNSFDNLPKFVKDKYKVTMGYVEVEFSEEMKNKTKEFIRQTIKEIESKNPNDESQWKPREIKPKDNFFCSNLCSYKKHCKEYSRFLENNKDLFENKENNDLLGKIFG